MFILLTYFHAYSTLIISKLIKVKELLLINLGIGAFILFIPTTAANNIDLLTLEN